MRILITFLILFIAANTDISLANEEKSDSIKINVSPVIALIYGNINEYVFDDGKKVSQLDWDVKPMFLSGTGISVTYSGFNLTGGLLYAVNDSIGKIRDYDWNSSTGEMTNYSKHAVKQRGSIFSKVEFLYYYHLSDNLSLFPIAGIEYNNIQLTAEDGYLEYPPGSVREPVYGKGIIYEQKYLIPYTGIGIKYDLNSFSLNTQVAYSRYLKCATRDSHVQRDIDFYDDINQAIFYFIEGEVLYKATELISISFICSWTYIPLAKGTSYYIDLSTGGKSDTYNNAGAIKADYKTVNISLNLRI